MITGAKGSTVDMTQGNIIRLILLYSLPLLAGNLFQNLYNTVDSLVVGNFLGKTSLAAIGATTSLVFMLVGFFNGLSTGGTIVISQLFGAKKYEKLNRAVHTMICGTFLLGLFFALLGSFYTPFLLHLMNVPEDVYEEAHSYLSIYFSGIVFLMLYNMGTGILRAVGDSKNPLLYLIISSLTNIVLDLIFVLAFKSGINGVAFATLLSQALSSALVLIKLFKTKTYYQMTVKKLCIDRKCLTKTIVYGLPGALQMTVTAFSNMFAQRYINKFGADCIAGQAVFQKIDSLALLPLITLGVGITTYASQNFGAGNIERVKKGNEYAVWLSVIITVLIGGTIGIFAPQLVGLFNRNEGVIQYGVFFTRAASSVCMIRSINEVYTGTLRGVGNIKMPMIIKIGSFVIFRQFFLFIVTRVTDSFFPVGISFILGWILCNVWMAVYYYYYMHKNYRKTVTKNSSLKKEVS